MNTKYYKFIAKGDEKTGGVLYSPNDWPYPIANDGEDVKNWQSLVVKLKDGKYRPFHLCVGGANMVNQSLKELLQSFIGADDNVEFLPVKAISEIYGNQVYYIMHFKKIFDVIDVENTIYAKGATDSIIKLRLDYNKTKDLDVFNSQPFINDIIVSDRVRKSIRKSKLDFGLEFMPIYCIKPD